MMACRKSLSHKSHEAGKYLGDQAVLVWPSLCQPLAEAGSGLNRPFTSLRTTLLSQPLIFCYLLSSWMSLDGAGWQQFCWTGWMSLHTCLLVTFKQGKPLANMLGSVRSNPPGHPDELSRVFSSFFPKVGPNAPICLWTTGVWAKNSWKE